MTTEKEKKEKKRQLQSDELYLAIGRFTVSFEHLVNSMRTTIISILSNNGLKNQKLSNIILSDLTAYPMKSILESMLYEVLVLNNEDKKILTNIFKRTQKLIETRNNIIHSRWFIGAASTDQTEFHDALGMKNIRTKDGKNLKTFSYKKIDFDTFSNECDVVTHLIASLNVFIILFESKGWILSKQFTFEEKNVVSFLKK